MGILLLDSGTDTVDVPFDPPPIPPPSLTSGITVTVGSVEHEPRNGWSIQASINSPHQFTADFDSVDGSYRPSLDQVVTCDDSGTRRFAGFVTDVEEIGFESAGAALSTKLTAGDFSIIVNRILMNGTAVTGTLKAWATFATLFLAEYGITLDPAQVDGPTLPELVYDDRKMADALTEAATLSGYVWRISYARVFGFYEPASYPAPFNVTDSNKKSVGDVKVRLSRMMGSGEYANYVKVHGGTEEEPVKASAFDSAAISATGKWMVAISSPTAKDYATASALANAYLIQHLTTPKIVEFSTRERGLIPGQVLTLTFARRNINGTYLITEVETQNEEFTAIIHRVTAIEGSVFKTNWRNLYQQWTSGQTTAYAIPGAGSTVGPGRAIHFLGAFENYWVQSTAGVYVSATNHGIQPQIDTTEWGSLSATVVVRMRALSGSVMARLQNMSASTTAGESIAITNSNFETVQFTVALTPGLQTYELQLKPSLSNVDINAVGYLE